MIDKIVPNCRSMHIADNILRIYVYSNGYGSGKSGNETKLLSKIR